MTTPTLQRILYVEDEPTIQEIAQLALEAIGGYTVEICSSGEEALVKAAAFAPDLILLDAVMPGMDGPATLMGLRSISTLATTPAIFMTAKVHPDELAQFKTLGALEVIPKPFDPMTLAEQINAVWCKQI